LVEVSLVINALWGEFGFQLGTYRTSVSRVPFFATKKPRFLKRCSEKFEVDNRIPQPVEWRWWDL